MLQKAFSDGTTTLSQLCIFVQYSAIIDRVGDIQRLTIYEASSR